MFSETHRSFRSRILFFYIVVMMVFGVLFFRYWYLQVVQGSGFYTAATENTLREVVVPSRRGRILASGGEVLADYEIAYNIMLDRNRLQPRRIPELARFLDLEVDEFQRRLHNYRRLPLYKAVPIMENLTFESVAKFEWIDERSTNGRSLRRTEIQVTREGGARGSRRGGAAAFLPVS